MTQATLALLGTIGVWLLVAAGLAILVELVLMGVWGAALGRRMLAVTKRLESERAQIQADLERLRAALEETEALWRPYRRILRWLNHPLILAVFASVRRRMAAP